MKRNSQYESITIRPNTHVSFSGEPKAPHRYGTSVTRWVLATLFLGVCAIATGLSKFLG